MMRCPIGHPLASDHPAAIPRQRGLQRPNLPLTTYGEWGAQ